MAASEQQKLVSVTLDENSIGRGSADQEHERAIAVYDLIENNHFALVGADGGPQNGGPYALNIALMDAKLVFDVRDEKGAPVVTHILSLTPFRRILKDYFLICESYYDAIRTATPTDLETLARWAEAMAMETEGKVLDGATIRAGIAAGLADSHKARYLVAEHGGHAVGTLMLTTEWSDRRNG